MKQLLDRLHGLHLTNPARAPVENPQQLGEIYWNELQELLLEGEISRRIAERVIADVFEPQPSTGPRSVTARIWQIHVEQQKALTAPNELSRYPDH